MSIRVVATVLIFGALSATTAQGGLLASDGARPVDAGHVEVELNGYYTVDKASRGGVTAKCHSTDAGMKLTAGIARGTDVSLTLQYTFISREKVTGGVANRDEGLNDATLDLKYRVFEHDGLTVSVRPGLILPTGNEGEGFSDGRTGYTAAILASREFTGGRIAVHANGGYERHNYESSAVAAISRSDIFRLCVATEAELTDGIRLATDLGLGTNPDRDSSTPVAYALLGAGFELVDDLEAYVGAKFGLTGPEDDFTGLFGLVRKF